MSFRKLLSPVWIVLCLAGLLTACGVKNQDPNAQYSVGQLQRIGEKFLAAGDFGQALKYLSMAEAKAPEEPVLQYDLGLAYEARGLRPQAVEHFRKALALKPNYSEAHNALGALYAGQGQWSQAEESFRKALANPFYETPQLAYFNLGQLFEAKGDTERALQHYQEAVRLQPTYGLAYYRMGLLLEKEFKRGDEARQAYGKAVQLAPDLAEAHLRYGVMSYTVGELDSAHYSLSRVVRLAPYSPMAEEAQRYLRLIQGAATLDQSTKAPMPAMRSPTGTASMEIPRDQNFKKPKKTRKPSAPAQLTPAQPPSPPLTLEPESNQETRPTSPEGSSPSTLNPQPVQASAAAPTSSAGPAEAAPPPMPKPGGEPPQAVPPPVPQWSYIVQLGSFLDKADAGELQKKLQLKGYKTVIKPAKHKVLGQVYVIQLKPVGSESTANTLLTQLQGEVEGKLVIIKVPVP